MSTFDQEPMLTHNDMVRRVAAVAGLMNLGDAPEFNYHPTGHEEMTATIEPMESIPPNANPFQYDDFSMGTDLPRNLVIMHPGFDRKEDPKAAQWLYIVNTRNGQRFKIRLEYKPTPEQVAQQKADWDKRYNGQGVW
jgi:hypothetical protein